MTAPALFSKVVLARIGLTTVVMLPIVGVWVGYERQQERNQRVAAIAHQQAQINVAQAKLDREIRQTAITRRNLVKLSNKIKLDSCHEANRRAKVAIEEAFKRDYALAAASITVGVTRTAANTFIATDMRLVIRANPRLNCSPKAIGVQPLPPIPARITSQKGPPGTSGTTVPPFVHRAGTTVPLPPATATTSPPRHGQRRRPPHPVHP